MTLTEIQDQLPWARGVRVLACDDNGLVAVEKPPAILSHPNRKVDREKSILSAPYDDDSQSYLVLDTNGKRERQIYLLNRLDSATSGIVLMALEPAVAEAVLKVFEQKKVRKIYQALVFGAPRSAPVVWKDRLAIRRVEGKVRAVPGNLHAETNLLRVEAASGVPPMSRLTLMPITGRTHQLRFQAAKRHIPIVGDRTYGDFQKNKLAAKRGLKRLCLHCVATELNYQLKRKGFRFKAVSECPF